MKNILVLAFFISFIVFLMSLSIYFFYITPVYEFSYSATAYVTENVGGFDLNSTALTFGSIAVGGSSTRTILVDNYYSFPVRVEPHVEGTISKIISYQPLIVGPNETSRFSFTVSADSFDLLGNYTGNVIIRLKRV